MKLNEVTFDGYTGVFESLWTYFDEQSIDAPEWLATRGDAKALDYIYVWHHSGEKIITKYFSRLLTDAGLITAGNMVELMKHIWIIMGDKWKHLYETFYDTDYDPIENYKMYEKETPNLTSTNSFKTSQKVYAFNSTAPQNASESVGDSNDNVLHQSGMKELERSGNIGVTTTQQMLEQELEIRKFNFYNQVFSDVDSFLCLNVYEI